MEFSKWMDDFEKESRPAFNKRLVNGVLVPLNLDSDLLQHYTTYKINKSNQELVRITWILAIVSILGSLASIIVSIFS